ncbi:MAG: hypothetical protein JMDDDDMK_01260 [Acidobacteria bacterium]|nr:hypothetical protein [Acidobacteriota bacterium]
MKRWGHLSYLIKEESSSLSYFKLAFLLRDGAGESALLVAEKLAFEQGLSQRRAVDGHERHARTWAVLVNGVRDQLLACARFSANQDGRTRGRRLGDELIDLAHSRAFANHIVFEVDLLLQPAVLLFQPVQPFETVLRCGRAGETLGIAMSRGWSLRWFILVEKKDENRVADLDAIAMRQRTLPDRHAVDEGPIEAFQIAEDELIRIALNKAMTPRNGGINEAKLVGWFAANRAFRFGEGKDRVLELPGDSNQPGQPGQSGPSGRSGIDLSVLFQIQISSIVHAIEIRSRFVILWQRLSANRHACDWGAHPYTREPCGEPLKAVKIFYPLGSNRI